ncbi:DNA-binding protein [Sulfurimicrobium lacus]|uniref:DNA-binding protein n=1 Tax=Sulfurimicrobium lacus TaxID=2715678 RepID=A0A6F8VE21_9PROT|nr:HEPN domain-containing protein [Sulfurimicrobium lacus]BCB27266.1 DNA-binding protein [Sulfurimicrobium lacus]
MTPALEEAWRLLRIAQGDRDAFLVLKNAPHIRLPVACFHAQQAVEKALKAVLTVQGVPFRRTHELAELAQLLSDHDVFPPATLDQLDALNPYAVVFRYDDSEIETLSRDEAEEIMESVLKWANNIALAT